MRPFSAPWRRSKRCSRTLCCSPAAGAAGRILPGWTPSPSPAPSQRPPCRSGRAIGHDPDYGVPDLVAHTHFKTPTAAVEEIVARFVAGEKLVQHANEVLRREWARGFERHRKVVMDDTVGVRQGTRKLMEQTRTRLVAQAEKLQIEMEQRIAAHRTTTETRNQTLHHAVERRTSAAQNSTQYAGRRMRDLSGHRLTQLHHQQRDRLRQIRTDRVGARIMQERSIANRMTVELSKNSTRTIGRFEDQAYGYC